MLYIFQDFNYVVLLVVGGLFFFFFKVRSLVLLVVIFEVFMLLLLLVYGFLKGRYKSSSFLLVLGLIACEAAFVLSLLVSLTKRYNWFKDENKNLFTF